MTRIKEPQREGFRKQFVYTTILYTLVCSFLLLRLACLQIWKGKEYRNLSENNRIRLTEIKASRGRILDADRTILVDNRPSFVVSVIPEEVQNDEILGHYLGSVYPLDKDELWLQIQNLRKAIPFRAVPIWKDASWEEMAYLEANKLRIPGVVLQVNEVRNYLYGNLFSHVTGYIGEVNSEEIGRLRQYAYKPGDFIGKVSIESQWERYLRGRDGGAQAEVDARGREIRILEKREPIPGNNVFLSIRSPLQKCAFDAFGKNNAGVAIAMDPRDGRILCYVSIPSYDPNQLAVGVSYEQWKSLSTHAQHPLTNRGIQGQYPAGSVFKVVMAVAALEEHVVSPGESLYCGGSYRVGNKVFRCWRKQGHGSVNLHRALVESCDVYFYQIGQRLGIERIARYATLFGFGHPTDIGLGGEREGLVPSELWKRKRFREPWYDGETVMVSIGQGYLLVTPIQILTMMATVANGGNRWTPRIVERVESIDGGLVMENQPMLKESLDISPSTLKLVQTSLRDVVMTRSGTGTRARVEGVEVAGKTGTAQVVRMGVERKKRKAVSREKEDHAWFTCYAPAHNPEIAVVVLLEHGGHGGESAAPIAREILRAYFSGKHPLKEEVRVSQSASSRTMMEGYGSR